MNPLLTEIAKPLTERKPWPWHRLEDGHLGRRVGNVNTVVPTLYEAEKIQALEDQPRLIAEVGRLQEQTDEYEGVIVQLESEVTRLQSQADEAASTIARLEKALAKVTMQRDDLQSRIDVFEDDSRLPYIEPKVVGYVEVGAFHPLRESVGEPKEKSV